MRSIQTVVILPILILISLSLILVIIVTDQISKRFEEEYASQRLQGEIVKLESIVEDGDNKTIQDISVKDFEIPTVTSPPFAIAVIKDQRDPKIFGSIDEETFKEINRLKIPDNSLKRVTLKRGNESITYYLMKKELKDVLIFVLIDRRKIPGLKSLSLMREAVIGGGLFIAFITLLILRSNLLRPIRLLTSDLKKGVSLRETGIKELDQLGRTINAIMERLEERSELYIMLHKIAIELNTTEELRNILKNILEYSKEILQAEYAALAIYDESGRFSDLIVSGVKEAPAIMPEGKGILKFMQLSLTPVRISDIKEHPAFSGTLPEWHPEIKGFLGYPIYSKEGRPLGALYFANKKTGLSGEVTVDFTQEDEVILKAISSDLAVALTREYTLEELRRFKRIIESAFDVIVITDREGNIVYVNKAFEEVTGYSRSEALGKNPRILKSGFHQQEFYQHLWQTILSGRSWKGEFVNRKKTGEIYHSAASIFPLFDSSGNITHFVSIQRDITEEKKLYEQLLRAQKMEAIGTLAGGIAHDFNNILTSVLGYAELLKEALSDNPTLFRYAEIIEKSANRGADLAKKILTVTRKEHAEFKAVNLNNIIMETVEILKKTIPKEIELEVKLRRDLPTIRADASQMSQVIMNLAINARDAMPEGGRLFIGTELVGSENGAANGLSPKNGVNFVRLTVEDTGSGIPQELQSKIFDPFFTTKEPGKGTGLGLYIVHSIVTNHGGYINLYSEPGRGTRFNIYLPVYVFRDDESKGDDLVEEKITGTVLVIDDEPYLCELYKDILTKEGFRVFTATTPAEGIKIFKENRIDLVVLDLIMPKMSGREVFQILRELNKESDIILSSGYSADLYSDIKRMMEGGAKAFLQKPVSPRTLVLTIKRILKEREG